MYMSVWVTGYSVFARRNKLHVQELTQIPGACHTRAVTHGHYVVEGVEYGADEYFPNGTVVLTKCKDGYSPSQHSVKCLDSMFWETFICHMPGI